jgi:hypothetical protein
MRSHALILMYLLGEILGCGKEDSPGHIILNPFSPHHHHYYYFVGLGGPDSWFITRIEKKLLNGSGCRCMSTYVSYPHCPTTTATG